MTQLVIRPKIKNDREFQTYLSHLDRATANQGMRALADKYGFPVTDIDGYLRTSSGWVRLLFGYNRRNSIREIMRRHDIKAPNLSDLLRPENVAQLIRAELGLQPGDGHSKLFDFATLLKVARFSRTQAAEEIMAYLHAQEGWARREQAVQRHTGLSTSQVKAQMARELPPSTGTASIRGVTIATIRTQAGEVVYCSPTLELICGAARGAVQKSAKVYPGCAPYFRVLVQQDVAAAKQAGIVAHTAACVAGYVREGAIRFAESPMGGRYGTQVAAALRRAALAGHSPAALPGGR